MKKLLSLCCFLAISGIMLAQSTEPQKSTESTNNLIVVHNKDGESVKGYMLSQDQDFLYLKEHNTLEVLKIPVNRIKQLEVLRGNYLNSVAPTETDSAKVSEQLPTNFNNNGNYILSTSAFNLGVGERIIKNNPMNFRKGITENFSLGVGSAFSALLVGAMTLYVNAKYTFQANDILSFKIGADALGVLLFEPAETGAAMLLNTGFTVGVPDAHLTATTYYGALSDLGGSGLFYSIAGKVALSNKFSLITESFILPHLNAEEGQANYLSLIAIRFHQPTYSLDAGYLTNPEISDFLPAFGIPFIAFTVSLD